MAIFVLGGPGSGKSTQCGLVANDRQVDHISVGDLLRSTGDPEILKLVAAGKIVPSDVTVGLIKKKLETAKSRILIDGFPRNLENLSAWMATEVPHSIPPRLIFLDCPVAVLSERLLQRSRSDDMPDVIERRLEVFERETMPVVRYYQLQYPDMISVIDANRGPEEIFADFSKLFA